MKNKIKIYLQSPWKRGAECSYYKFLRQDLPKNIIYVNKEPSEIIQNKNKLRLNNFLKQKIKKIIRKFYPSMPNVHYTKNAKKYDLIHCAHCLSKNKQPWICDIEFVGQFWAGGFSRNFPSKKRVLEILKCSHCKKILAWTKWAAKEIIKEFPEIKNKVEVVYPAIPIQKFKKISSKKIRLLFVARKFYFKGGLYAVEIMDRLTKKYKNVFGTIVSDVPKKVYEKYKNNKKIIFMKMLPQKKLFKEIYPSSDILIYPSPTDTFGFVFIEAMSFGLPIITVDGRSREEIVDNGKLGYVVKTGLGDIVSRDILITLSGKEKIINELCEKTSGIIENKRLKEKMSKECIKVIKEGKFSIKKRNEKLKKIYKECYDKRRN